MAAQPDNEVFDAARTALANWLRLRLIGNPYYGSLVVFDDWPESSQELPPFALTVLSAGDPDYVYFPPVDIQVTPTTGALGDVTYTYGHADSLPLQIDVFATSPTARDALLRDVIWQLNVSPQVSLAGTSHDPGGLPDYRTQPGLVLELPDRYFTLCSYDFAPTASPTESSGSAQTGEWRAVLRGQAQCALVTQDEMALIKRLPLSDTSTGDDLAVLTVP